MRPRIARLPGSRGESRVKDGMFSLGLAWLTFVRHLGPDIGAKIGLTASDPLSLYSWPIRNRHTATRPHQRLTARLATSSAVPSARSGNSEEKTASPVRQTARVTARRDSKH